MKLTKVFFFIIIMMCSFTANAQKWEEIDRTETRVFYINPKFEGRIFEFKEEITDSAIQAKLVQNVFVDILKQNPDPSIRICYIIRVHKFNEDFTKNQTLKMTFQDSSGKTIYEQKFNDEDWAENKGRLSYYGSVAKHYYK